MKNQTETDLVRACLDTLVAYGAFAVRVNTTGVYDPVRKVFRKLPEGRRGTSDVLGLLPTHAGHLPGLLYPMGRFVAVECKRPGEKLRPDQQRFLEEVERYGGVALVAHSVGELIDDLKGLGVSR